MHEALIFIAGAIAIAHDCWRITIGRHRPLSGRIGVLEENVQRLEVQSALLRTRLLRLPARRRFLLLLEREAAAEALLEVRLLGPDHGMEAPVLREHAVADEHVQMRMEVGAEGTEGLDRDDGAGRAVGLTGGLAKRPLERAPGRLGHHAVKPPLLLDQAAQTLGHREDDVAVGHVEQHVPAHPLGKDGRAPSAARGAQVPRAAGERQEMLGATLGAADPGEAPHRATACEVGMHVAADEGAERAAYVEATARLTPTDGLPSVDR